jgi:glycerol uptake facilitator-like aquaporin
MNQTPHPMWARALIEAGKTAVFLAFVILAITWIDGVLTFQPGALIILALILALAVAIAREYWHEWRDRAHT